MLCDGADLGFLALSLTSLKTEFHLTGVQAGTLGSLTLLGSAVGGLIGGWACDRFGRVRIIVFFIAFLQYSLVHWVLPILICNLPS